MGIVLPEGVLNNSALQRVREYVEGKAKIINITSIPQDVFIASGATVKPSLLFLKKFTEEEASQYDAIVIEIKDEVTKKYEPEFTAIEEKLNEANEVYKVDKNKNVFKVARKKLCRY